MAKGTLDSLLYYMAADILGESRNDIVESPTDFLVKLETTGESNNSSFTGNNKNDKERKDMGKTTAKASKVAEGTEKVEKKAKTTRKKAAEVTETASEVTVKARKPRKKAEEPVEAAVAHVEVAEAPVKKRGRKKAAEATETAASDATTKTHKTRKKAEPVVQETSPAEHEASDNLLCTDNDNIKKMLMGVLRSRDDLQKLRIQTGNRLTAYLVYGGDTKAAAEEEERDSNSSNMKAILSEFERVSELAHWSSDSRTIHKAVRTHVAENNAKFIKSYADYVMVSNYNNLLESEKSFDGLIDNYVKQHPLWDAFFKDIKGCGTMIAAVCICSFNIDAARHASSFWRYCGLDVVVKDDGTTEGRSRRSEHLVEVEYTDKNGNVQTRKSLGYNPDLKCKLVGVLGPCLLKSGLRSEKDGSGTKTGNRSATGYARAYLDYYNRLCNRANADEITKLHKHNMAVRYMVKQFVRDLWVVWRDMAGYEVSEPYEVAFLGRKHHGYNEALAAKGLQ